MDVKVSRLLKDEACVIGDASKDSCIIIKANKKSEIGIDADMNIPIQPIETAVRRCHEQGLEPSSRVKRFLSMRDGRSWN